MTPFVEWSVVALVSVFLFLLTLLCFSLRDFSRRRLQEVCDESGRSERFSEILKNYERTLLLSEMLLLLSLLAASSFALRTTYFVDLVFPETVKVVTVAFWLLRMTGITIVIALTFVVLPWTLSRVIGELFLCRCWPLVRFASSIAAPVWTFSAQVDRIFHRIFEVPEPDSEDASKLLTEELLTVVDESHREGVIQSNASNMIHRVVDLQTEDIAAIMTPRTEMVTLNADTSISDATDELLENGYSRVPVIDDGIDNIVGILYARDLLACAVGQEAETKCVADITRPVFYVPESQQIGDLLESMRGRKVHMAIVVDEYSGVSGLVTLEDVLEEIIGDIADEYDTAEEELWKEHTDGRTDVDGRFHLDDLNREFHYELPEDEEYDTIGGFMLSRFGRIPDAGEEHVWEGLKFTVLRAGERRIDRVRIERLDASDSEVVKE